MRLFSSFASTAFKLSLGLLSFGLVVLDSAKAESTIEGWQRRNRIGGHHQQPQPQAQPRQQHHPQFHAPRPQPQVQHHAPRPQPQFHAPRPQPQVQHHAPHPHPQFHAPRPQHNIFITPQVAPPVVYYQEQQQYYAPAPTYYNDEPRYYAPRYKKRRVACRTVWARDAYGQRYRVKRCAPPRKARYYRT